MDGWMDFVEKSSLPKSGCDVMISLRLDLSAVGVCTCALQTTANDTLQSSRARALFSAGQINRFQGRQETTRATRTLSPLWPYALHALWVHGLV